MNWLKSERLATLAKQAMVQAKEGVEKASSAIDKALQEDPNAPINTDQLMEFDGMYFLPPPTVKTKEIEKKAVFEGETSSNKSVKNTPVKSPLIPRNEGAHSPSTPRDITPTLISEHVQETQMEEVEVEVEVVTEAGKIIESPAGKEEGDGVPVNTGDMVSDCLQDKIKEEENIEDGKEESIEDEKEEEREAQQDNDEAVPVVMEDEGILSALPAFESVPTLPNDALITTEKIPATVDVVEKESGQSDHNDIADGEFMPTLSPFSSTPSSSLYTISAPPSPCPSSPSTVSLLTSAATNAAFISKQHVPNDQILLEQRERQLLTLSRHSVELQEEVERLRLQYKESTMVQKGATGELERVVKERDVYLSELDNLRHRYKALEEIEQELQGALAEKESEAGAIMAEGLVLSKKLYTRETAMKKMQVELRESEKKLERSMAELADKTALVEKHIGEIKDLERQQSKYKNTIQHMQDVGDAQGRDIIALRREVAQLRESEKTLRSQTISLTKDLEELKVDGERRVQEAVDQALTSGHASQLGAEEAIEEVKRSSLEVQDGLRAQIDEIRTRLEREERKGMQRERMYQEEIQLLQNKLHEEEEKFINLSGDMADVTKPLLKRLESLQQANREAQAGYEEGERELLARIDQLNLQVERTELTILQVRQAASTATDTANNALEQLASEQRHRGMVENKLKEANKLVASLQIDNQMEQERGERLRKAHEKEKEEYIAKEIEYQRQLVHNTKKLADFSDKIRELEIKCQQLETVSTQNEQEDESDGDRSVSLSTMRIWSGSSDAVERLGGLGYKSTYTQPISRQESTSSMTSNDATHILRHISSPSHLGEDGKDVPQSTLVRHLRFALRQREGEVLSLQRQLGEVETSKTALTEELSRITVEIEDLKAQACEVPSLRAQVKESEKKYNAALQMYGEKAEQAEELRLDLLDVKGMYRQQIDDLIGRLEIAQKRARPQVG